MKKDPKIVYEKLNKLDYTLVEYKLRTLEYSKREIVMMRKECLRYLALKTTQPRLYAPSFLVDEYWHQMILCTKFYESVTKVCGRFMHHAPNDGTKKCAKRNKNGYWDSMQAIYDNFGELNENIWGVEKRGRGVKQ